MSTMLRSTNPAAVNEIDPHRDRRMPYVGQSVIYHMRPGEYRSGKSAAPALVMGVEDEDHVEITIIFSADDFITKWKIPRKTEQNPVNAWSFNAHDQEWYLRSAGHPGEPPPPQPGSHLTWDDVKAMHAELGVLRHKVAALEAKPKRGRPPEPSSKGKSDHDEIEGAEFASEFRDESAGP